MDRWRRGGDPTQAELEAATRATDTLDAMMDAVETAGEDSALADRARDTAVRLRGAPQDGEAESPKEGGQTAAEIPPSEAPKGASC